MLKTFLLLAAIGLALARPNEEINERRYEPHPDCPPIHHHFLIPHESDCSLFYYCEYGLKWVEPRQCAPGTHFSYEEQVCVHPWQAGCSLPGPGPNPNPNPNPNPTTGPAPSPCDPLTTTPGTETPCNTTPQQPETPRPTDAPTPAPTDAPTPAPTEAPTPAPTEAPTPAPTDAPTPAPTVGPQPTNPPAPEPTTNAPSPCDPNLTTPGPCHTTPAPVTRPEPGELLPNGCPADFDIDYLYAHSTYCNKYYQCVHGHLVERLCAAGTHFNYETQRCDWPSEVGCEGEIYVPETTVAPEPVPTTPRPGPGETFPNGCPVDYTKEYLLPHETYCNKYYQCVHGSLVARPCAPGTHFNYEKQECDWPYNVGCEGEIWEPPTEPPCDEDDTPATNAPNPGPGPGPNPNPTTPRPGEDIGELLPNGCPANFSVHHLLPHETYCNKFYVCVWGTTVERVCAEGTVFNFEEQACDWPFNVDCDGDIYVPPTEPPCDEDTDATVPPVTLPPTQPPVTLPPTQPPVTLPPTQPPVTLPPTQPPVTLPPTEPPVTLPPTEPPVTLPPTQPPVTLPPTQPPVTLPPTQPPVTLPPPVTEPPCEDDDDDNDIGELLPNGCPANFSVEHLLPHDKYCNKFYQCVHGDLVAMKCAEGTHFNYELQRCDWPSNVNCDGDEYISDEDSNSIEDDPVGDPSGEEPDQPWEPLPNGCPSDFQIHHLLPHEYDCSKFYFCVRGNTIPGDCPEGTLFSFEQQGCDWPQYVDCENGEGPGDDGPGDDGPGDDGPDDDDDDISDEGPGGEDDGPGDDGPGDDGPGDDDSGSGELIPPGDDNAARCRDECNVAPWAHDNNCDKYWTCNGERLVLITCSEGLQFNPNTNTCDFACNVGCVRKEIQASERYDGVSVFLPWDKIDDDIRNLLESKLH